MNAGVKEYEIFNILHSLKIDNIWIKKDEIEYGYRFAKLNGVVTEAKFKIDSKFDPSLLKSLLTLRNNQPSDPSAGSAFKNPPNDYAGRLIQEVGLKGFRKGDMAWSEIHSNFLVNLGDGKYQDAQFLIDLAKKKVYEKFGVELIEEIEVL